MMILFGNLPSCRLLRYKDNISVLPTVTGLASHNTGFHITWVQFRYIIVKIFYIIIIFYLIMIELVQPFSTFQPRTLLFIFILLKIIMNNRIVINITFNYSVFVSNTYIMAAYLMKEKVQYFTSWKSQRHMISQKKT